MKRIKQALVFLLLAAILLSCAACFGKSQTGNGEPESSKYVIHLAELEDHVEIHTADQANYLNDSPENITAYIPKITNTERSYPKEIELSWSINDNEILSSVTYEISIGTSPAMTDARTYTTTNTSYQITNLYIDTTYYWSVSFVEKGITYTSETATFTTTSQGPRNLKIEGVTNCRDIGGWVTVNGPTVKQGMIYRTGKLSNSTNVFITDTGKKTMLEELGVKTEIDLRTGSTEIRQASVLDGVRVLNFGVASTATIYDLEEVLPEIFEVLADENNYPIFYHCNIGTDRTGLLTYLINGLLGVSEENLYYDYCFSNFGELCSKDDTSFTPRTPDYLQNRLCDVLRHFSGNTLQKKIRNYLKSLGITDATLNSVVRLMLQ